MKSAAKRLFGRYNQEDSTNQYSSFFKSKVNRQLQHSKNNQLGPGQYEISLPLVKPQFQAIKKKNNTIIIRLNQKHSPVFQSASPRFKNPEQISTKAQMLYEQNKQFQNLRMQRNMSERKQKKEKSDEYKTSQQQSTMKAISKKYKKPKQQKNIQLKNQSMIHSKSRCLQNFLKSQNPYLQLKKQLQTIQIYQKQKQTKYQSIIKHNRGTQWSKYKQQRLPIWQIKDQNPGPGSYRLKPRKIHKQHVDSWQFRSITQRQPFQPGQNNIKSIEPARSNTIEVTWGVQRTDQNKFKKQKRCSQLNRSSFNRQKTLTIKKSQQGSYVDLQIQNINVKSKQIAKIVHFQQLLA